MKTGESFLQHEVPSQREREIERDQKSFTTVGGRGSVTPVCEGASFQEEHHRSTARDDSSEACIVNTLHVYLAECSGVLDFEAAVRPGL